VSVANIDTTAPTIISTTTSPTAATSGSVIVTVNASDAGAGLDTTAYSFDEGSTWQAEDRKVFTENQTVNVKIRDAIGNITGTVIEISNIDTLPPVVTLNGTAGLTLSLGSGYTEF
jgi:hypothetical protein